MNSNSFQTMPHKRLKDGHVIKMLMMCRESSENTHFLVKGLNLGFRDCPYVLLINVTDLENRIDNALSSRDVESVKSMLNSVGADMLGSVILLEQFFGLELLARKVPIVMKIVTVLRDHQGSPDTQQTNKEFSNIFKD